MGVSKYDALSQLYIEDESKKDIEPNADVIKNGTNGTRDDDGDDSGEDDDNYRSIELVYTNTDVKVSSTSIKVDVNTFISNVGGSLGLFIGFSVLGGFFFVYDVISSRILSNI